METNLENAVIISVVGFGVVLICLVFFALIIAGTNKLDQLSKAKNKRKSEELSNLPVKNGNKINADEEILPVIMAAVYATVSKNVIIRKITFSHDEAFTADTAWAQISRAKKIDSHNIQRTRVIYESK